MPNPRIRFSAEFEVDLDQVPGAWHQPEDHQNVVKDFFERTFSSYGGKVIFTGDPYSVIAPAPTPAPKDFVEVHTVEVAGYYHRFYIEAKVGDGVGCPLERASYFEILYAYDITHDGAFDDAETVDTLEVEDFPDVGSCLRAAQGTVTEYQRFLRMLPHDA